MARRNKTEQTAQTTTPAAAEQAAAPASTKATKTPAPCGCGCGATGSGRFRPGHDARLHGRIKRHAEGRLPQAEWDAMSKNEQNAVLDGQHTERLGGSFARPSSKPAPKTEAQKAADKAANRTTRAAKAASEALCELRQALRGLGLDGDVASVVLGDGHTTSLLDLVCCLDVLADEAAIGRLVATGSTAKAE